MAASIVTRRREGDLVPRLMRLSEAEKPATTT
jgi:hypothetical protein